MDSIRQVIYTAREPNKGVMGSEDGDIVHVMIGRTIHLNGTDYGGAIVVV